MGMRKNGNSLWRTRGRNVRGTEGLNALPDPSDLDVAEDIVICSLSCGHYRGVRRAMSILSESSLKSPMRLNSSLQTWRTGVDALRMAG